MSPKIGDLRKVASEVNKEMLARILGRYMVHFFAFFGKLGGLKNVFFNFNDRHINLLSKTIFDLFLLPPSYPGKSIIVEHP